MPRHPLVVSTRSTCLERDSPVAFFDPGSEFAGRECGRLGTVANVHTNIGCRHEWNLRAARESTREMLDPHAHDVGEWRAKRNCQERALKGVASVLDRTHRSVNDQFAALRGDRTGLGGVVGNHTRLEQPLAIGKFHVEAQRIQESGFQDCQGPGTDTLCCSYKCLRACRRKPVLRRPVLIYRHSMIGFSPGAGCSRNGSELFAGRWNTSLTNRNTPVRIRVVAYLLARSGLNLCGSVL